MITYIQTPIHKLHTPFKNINLYIKRDDLLPFSFGGNKARIAQEFYNDMDAHSKNCMIGYGNARSNLCRVIANMNSMRNGICHIISPTDDNEKQPGTNNSKLAAACGTIIHTCNKQNVAEAVNSVLNECIQAGLSPYYIFGDIYGNGNEAIPVRAYIKVYQEIMNQAKAMQVNFDYIVLATGTGMTQAGLLAGKYLNGGTEEILGISIAREKGQETVIIQKYVNAYFESVGMKNGRTDILISDDYLTGGYGKFNCEILTTIKEMYKTNGIALDPVYTGKAYYGMIDYFVKHNIKNKNVLFIHTGGTPLFFDHIDAIIK